MLHVVTGQTATGKTAYAIELAKKINGELINIDARQIYKDLSIVTGKELAKGDKFYFEYKIGDYDIGYYLLDDIKIWLYDLVSLNEACNAYEFSKIAQKVISNIKKRGKAPILVGGSHFYLKSILFNAIDTNTEPDINLRKSLYTLTTTSLQEKLKEMDLVFFNSLNNSEKNNPHRLIRKIELLSHNKSFGNQRLESRYDFDLKKMLHENQDIAKEKIKKRVQLRIDQGAIDEIKKILDSGISKDSPGLKTIGAVQILNYLQGNSTLENAVQEWILKELQYCKRQKTGYSFLRDTPSRGSIP